MRVTRCHGVNRTGCEHKLQGKEVDEFPLSERAELDRRSVSEPTAVFAVGEFAEAVEDRRRSEDRKSVVPALKFLSHPVPNYPKQEFLEWFYIA